METLSIDLFEPGMGPLHRAGLGGLAATLRWIDDRVTADRRPTGRWSFNDRRVELAWDAPKGTAFFRRLYELSFQLQDGLIHLPGSYPVESPPQPWIKAELQQGLSMTILQFGPNRKATGFDVKRYDDGNGHSLQIQHQHLVGYTHQRAWEDLVTSNGALKARVPISGTIAPGFVQRHVAYDGATTIEQPPGPAIALHFALVGTLSLMIDRKTGVMIVPDVEDLIRFVRRRGLLTPREAKDCRVSSPADAALQAQLRLVKEEAGSTLRIDRCLAVLFATKSWNKKQKARATVLDVEPSPADLERFEVAMQSLAPRIALARPKEPGLPPEPFWVDSVVRPLVAENLAAGRPWFHDFRRLIVSPDGSDDEQKVRLLGYEREGLRAMIDLPWSDQGEEALVEAVHKAMEMQFAKIGEDAKGDPITFGNRCQRQMERWRLSFAGAKTPDEVRRALTDLWSRVGQVPLLRDTWRNILPLLCEDRRWQLNRDLALLALASYKGDSNDAGGVTPGAPALTSPAEA